MTSNNATTGIFAKLFAVFAYLCSMLTMTAYFLVFLMPSRVVPDKILTLLPYTLDTAPTVDTAAAVLVELFLMTSFVVFHSALARPSVKAFMGLPVSLERSFFMMQTNVFLALQIFFWRNFDGPPAWNVLDNGFATKILVTINLCGYLFLVTSTLALDHFHLFGLSQAFGVDFNQMVGLSTDTKFVMRWHYNLVAHPIMTGCLIMYWATPYMTLPRLLVASVMTSYIFIAVRHFEEPDLTKEFGVSYVRYLQKVPRFFPGCAFAHKDADEEEAPILVAGDSKQGNYESIQ